MSRASKIDSRNTTTKNFFNFSYKRYRFHFGIYIPCSHNHSTPGLILPKGTCQVQTPFMMSDFRRACVIHQPLFFKNDAYKNIKPRKNKSNAPPRIRNINHKTYHANLLYDRWRKNEKKIVISRRLGISFEQTLHARMDNNTRKTFNRHMYKKKLSNFSLCRSDNTHVNKAQQIHFERSKRRVFNSKEHNPYNRKHHRLITAQRYRFLYTPLQSINKPIKHLQYTHGWDQSKYNFQTPLRSNYLPPPTVLSEDVSFINPVLTVAPYNPIPDMFFPAKYKNIIPKDPIYNEQGAFIIPGSREWFTYMHNIHINLPPPLTKGQKRAIKQRERNIMLNKKHCEDAKFHGTSFNRFNRRRVAIKSLTDLTNTFDSTMKDLVNYYQTIEDPYLRSCFHSSMVNQASRISDRTQKHRNNIRSSAIPSGTSEDTSDATVELEK
ncbi:hypothetical protein RhiirA1_474831 [Rhizophagus irregularis]|uniref:DUF8211 domain-containing protein n=1 Tax=Rhizophagus irregularis TaxID=588596 RepID=A0A2N0QXW8_9GLOM|nr:hypothetical protein RhiirA1_474831 [Rhizophagus irregularis]